MQKTHANITPADRQALRDRDAEVKPQSYSDKLREAKQRAFENKDIADRVVKIKDEKRHAKLCGAQLKKKLKASSKFGDRGGKVWADNDEARRVRANGVERRRKNTIWNLELGSMVKTARKANLYPVGHKWIASRVVPKGTLGILVGVPYQDYVEVMLDNSIFQIRCSALRPCRV